jgi:hypothetical protein
MTVSQSNQQNGEAFSPDKPPKTVLPQDSDRKVYIPTIAVVISFVSLVVMLIQFFLGQGFPQRASIAPDVYKAALPALAIPSMALSGCLVTNSGASNAEDLSIRVGTNPPLAIADAKCEWSEGLCNPVEGGIQASYAVYRVPRLATRQSITVTVGTASRIALDCSVNTRAGPARDFSQSSLPPSLFSFRVGDYLAFFGILVAVNLSTYLLLTRPLMLSRLAQSASQILSRLPSRADNDPEQKGAHNK